MKKLLLFLPFLAWCQPPDCTLPINVPVGATLPFNIGPFDNRTTGCTTWQITYNNDTTKTGAYTALSIIVQTAPNANGVAGAYSTFAAVTGVNPNTATTEAVSTFGGVTSYFPWVRVQLTSATGAAGTISGRLYGWRIPAQSSGGTVTIPTPVPVDGPTASGSAPTTPPVLVAGQDGTNLRTLKTDTSGDAQVQLIGNGAVLSGQQSVTGSAVALATNTARAACVKALVSNSINVFVGPTGITTSTGYLLAPGESVCFPVTNTNLLFVIASTTGASVSWAASN